MSARASRCRAGSRHLVERVHDSSKLFDRSDRRERREFFDATQGRVCEPGRGTVPADCFSPGERHCACKRSGWRAVGPKGRPTLAPATGRAGWALPPLQVVGLCLQDAKAPRRWEAELGRLPSHRGGLRQEFGVGGPPAFDPLPNPAAHRVPACKPGPLSRLAAGGSKPRLRPPARGREQSTRLAEGEQTTQLSNCLRARCSRTKRFS